MSSQTKYAPHPLPHKHKKVTRRIKRKPPPVYDPAEFFVPADVHIPDTFTESAPRVSLDEHSFMSSGTPSQTSQSFYEVDFWEALAALKTVESLTDDNPPRSRRKAKSAPHVLQGELGGAYVQGPSESPSVSSLSVKRKLSSLFGSSRTSLFTRQDHMSSASPDARYVIPSIPKLGPMLDANICTGSMMSSSASDTLWDRESREAEARFSALLDVLPPDTSTVASSECQCSASSTSTLAYPSADEPPSFDEYALPTRAQIQQAATLHVIAESGVRVPFGDLWMRQKSIVLFIRHFMCPLCQDYMVSVSRNVSPTLLRKAGVELVIISNGAHEMIHSYRKIFRMPFALYTDPGHQVYNALGMTLQTTESGPRGSYVRHGLVGGIGMVLVNAVKVGMPIWKSGGEISQLGGEFILGPGAECSFAHRMRYTRDHRPILDLLAEAGVNMHTSLDRMTPAEDTEWRAR